MSYKSILLIHVLTVLLFVSTVIFGIRIIGWKDIYLSEIAEATVAFNDEYGTYGYADLYTLDENNTKSFFVWYYPNDKSGVKKDEIVLVKGTITYDDRSTGANSHLMIVGKTKAKTAMAGFMTSATSFLILIAVTIYIYIKKSGDKKDEIQTKKKISRFIESAVILVLILSLYGTFCGVINIGKSIFKQHHVTGTVCYTTKPPENLPYSIRKSQHLFTRRYDKNVQVILDEPVNGSYRYSVTYYDTTGQMIFKGQRVIVSYNEFEGNDGNVIPFINIIVQSASALYFAGCTILFKITSKNRQALSKT